MNLQLVKFDFPLNITGISSADGKQMVLDVRGMSVATVQVVAQAAWSGAVVTIYRANCLPNGDPFLAALETATTLTADGMTSAIDVSAFAFLVLKVTTTGASTTATAFMYAQE